MQTDEVNESENDQPAVGGVRPPDESAAMTRDRLVAAAYAAEHSTGRRERSREEAKRNIVVRIVIIGVGGIIFLAGLGMLIFPGPGILVSLVGLGILAREFAWAANLMTTLREKSHVDEVGKLPIWAQVLLGLLSMAAVVAGVAWLFFLR